MSVTLRNELKELEALRIFLDEAAGRFALEERLGRRLQLVCDELVTNIVSYGYGKERRGGRRIEVDLTVTAERLDVRLTDDGLPFNPLDRPMPDVQAPLEERDIGGLGVYLATALTDERAYVHDGRHNILRLTWYRREPQTEENG